MVQKLATVCQCQQLLGNKTLALEIRVKERAEADYVGKKKNKNEKTKNCSLLCRNSLKGVESRVTTFEGIN